MKRLAAAIVTGLAFALPVSAQTKWDLPTAYPTNNFHTENLQQFAADVDKATAGKLKLQLHPNASLFKAPEIKRAVQGGQAQAGEILLVNFENEDPLYGIDGVPFLATSYAESMKLYKAERKALDDKLAKQGMMLLYAVRGRRRASTEPHAEQRRRHEGLKWRAYGPATSKIAELVGAQSVSVQAAEVSQALATGVIDSYMSSGATGFDSKTYEQLKPATTRRLGSRRTPSSRTARPSTHSTSRRRPRLRNHRRRDAGLGCPRKTGWYIDQLKQKGMTIDKPSEQLTADMRKVGNVMLVEWLRKAGPEGKKIVDQYRALQ
jgi:TRAP-type C4-dicarboxylate transport system substrate-binding protein